MDEENLHAELLHTANGAESNFNEKIDCILVKLNKPSKLEDIDSKLDGLIANVKVWEEKVNHFKLIKDTQVKHDDKIKELEESSQFNDEILNTVEENI